MYNCTVLSYPILPGSCACSSSSRQQFSNSIVASTMCVYVKVFFFRVKRSKYEVKAMVIKRLYYITSQAGQDWIFSQIVIVPAKVPRRWSRWNLGSVRRAPTFSGSAASECTTASSWSHVWIHFNISFPDNLLSKKLLAREFKQLVEYLSHIEGIIIDHVYISNKVDRQLVVLDHHPVYYSDYDLFALNLSCWSWVVFEICLKSVHSRIW